MLLNYSPKNYNNFYFHKQCLKVTLDFQLCQDGVAPFLTGPPSYNQKSLDIT